MLHSTLSHLIPQLWLFWRKHAYSRNDFLKDLLSGLTVAIVALPLAMAIAIASNLPPERGLFTAIVAGFLISALGGSRYQIGGPTAAFIVTVAMVAMKHGYEGLVIATLMAGVMLIIAALLRAGELIKFFPYPVIVGFTSGIAILIFFSQLRDFFGLSIAYMPPDFIDKLFVYLKHLHQTNPYAVLVASLSIGTIILVNKFIKKLPAPIVVVVLSSLAVWLFGIPVETIESRFGSIPSTLPMPSLPAITFEKVRLLFSDALTIALLAGIESLLSAVVADGMTGTKHRSNTELFAQGVANVGSAFMGGLPATGAIARTATNIKAGAVSPISGMLHAVWLLLFMLLLAPLIVKVPLAALAAILIVVAYNMSEIKHIRSIMKAPRTDRVVLFVTLFLTVIVDLNTAILVGISLASLLFIRSMMHATPIASIHTPLHTDDPDAIGRKEVPVGVEVYEIQGPLFFGVAEKLVDTLLLLESTPRVFILRLRFVPIIDAAGLHALEALHHQLSTQGATLILSGVNAHVRTYLHKSALDSIIGDENIVDHIDKALARASRLL
ncbi:MAG: sulfate permease [Sulfuricurvum sp. PC08-66]|nr:MAG: sulfate permease [Sulfuricurvum sp. PC08-66]